jgi:hypothetical protein
MKRLAQIIVLRAVTALLRGATRAIWRAYSRAAYWQRFT